MDDHTRLYSKILMDYYRNHQLVGTLINPHFSEESINEACGDIIRIMGIIEKGKIADIRYQGSGCILSQASASFLAHHVLHKPTATVLALTEQEFCALAQIEVGPYRLRCAILALQALQKGVESYVRPH